MDFMRRGTIRPEPSSFTSNLPHDSRHRCRVGRFVVQHGVVSSSIQRHNSVRLTFSAIMRRVFVSLLFALSHLLSAAEKPDVLVILADQWSPRFTGWDNQEVRTPHMDRIAAEGMIFDACYVTSPVCMPARVSLLTGLYPHNSGHGLWGNAADYFPKPEDAPMFLDIQRAGHATAQIGKNTLDSRTGMACAIQKQRCFLQGTRPRSCAGHSRPA
jgi:hypothetical protein